MVSKRAYFLTTSSVGIPRTCNILSQYRAALLLQGIGPGFSHPNEED